MDDSASPARETRQKRVQPSRSKSKRVATGVGSSDIDIMILDQLKRKHENEPLIPLSTKFFLTTNSTIASSSTSESSHFNVVANERYFNRPEVLESFRKQSLIETPSFSKLDDTHPGGRLRARSQSGSKDEDNPELADAIYLKRHRKFEQFEKRGRLREREKLQHEHYKLKERIEQLEKLDGSAFLSISEDYFPASQQVDDTMQQDNIVMDNAYIFGTVSAEGERRRREMLAIAHSLDDRYRRLLPPRKKTETHQQPLPSTGIITDDAGTPDSPEELPSVEVQRVDGKIISKPKSKATQPPSTPVSTSRPESAKKTPKNTPSPSKKPPSYQQSKVEEQHAPEPSSVAESEPEMSAQEEIEPHEEPPPEPEPTAEVENEEPTQPTTPPRSASEEPEELTYPVHDDDEDDKTSLEAEAETPVADEESAPEEEPLAEEPPEAEPETVSVRPRKRRRLSQLGVDAVPVPSGPAVKEMSVPPTITALTHYSERGSQSRASTVQPRGRLQRLCTLEHHAKMAAGNKSKRQVMAFGAPLSTVITKDAVKDYYPPYTYFPLPEPSEKKKEKGGYSLRAQS